MFSVCAVKKRRNCICFISGETTCGLSIAGTKRQPVRKARNRPLFSSLVHESKLKELKCNVSLQCWSESDHICCLLGTLSGHRCCLTAGQFFTGLIAQRLCGFVCWYLYPGFTWAQLNGCIMNLMKTFVLISIYLCPSPMLLN